MTYKEWKDKKDRERATASASQGKTVAQNKTSPSTGEEKKASSYEEWKNKRRNNARSTAADRVNQWVSEVRRFSDAYTARYKDGNQKYRTDSAYWLENATKSRDLMRDMAMDIGKYMEENRHILGDDFIAQATDMIREGRKFQSSVVDQAQREKDYYSQWENEDAYNEAMKAQQEYEAKRSFDTKAGQQEVAQLENVLKEYQSLSRWETDEEGKQRLKELKQRYGGEKGIRDLITQKNVYLTEAERIQNADRLSQVSQNRDFRDFSGYTSTHNDSPWSRLTGTEYDETYEYINNQDGIRDEITQKHRSYSRDNPWSDGEFVLEEKGYDRLTPDEVAIYNYHYAKNGKEAAQEYLDSIQETLNWRKSDSMVEAMLGNTGLELAFALATGIDQWESGMKSLLNTGGEYTPVSATQMASAQVREDLAERSKAAGVAYDVITTTANMAPSILTSTVANILAPGSGAVIGSAMMGASAGGSAYQEMINAGYSKDQARTYGMLVGASETILGNMLGGVSKLGGKVSGHVIQKAMNKADNVIFRVATKVLGNMASEGFEEAAQEALTPWFKSLLTGEEYAAAPEDVLYAGLLGALSAGLLEGPTSVMEAHGVRQQGLELKAAGIAPERLAQIGQTFSADTVAYQLAGRVNENTDAYTMGRLFNEIDAELTQLNKDSITSSLMSKGMDERHARKLAEGFAAVVTGTPLTEDQVKAIAMNDVLARTVDEVIINPNSTARQRSQGFNEVLRTLADGGAEAAPEVNPETTPTVTEAQDAAPESQYEASADGKTILKSTGETVGIRDIAQSQNGKLRLNLEDGRTVDAEDVSFGSEDEAMVYSAVAEMNVHPMVANVLLENYRLEDTEAEVYAKGIQEAYRFGENNYPMSMAAKGPFTSLLTPRQRDVAYQMGQTFGGKRVAKAQAIARTTAVKNTGPGKVHFDGDRTALSERQQVSLTALDRVASALGVQIHIFDSKSDRRYADKNGWFDPDDNSIHIDLYAGEQGKDTILFTASHELTHFVKKWSPAKFKVLSNFLMQEYGKQDVTVDELVQEQIRFAKSKGREISPDKAFEEVIANSMEQMLADGNVIEKMEKLKAQDRSVWEKIRDYIKGLAAKIRKVYEGIRADSEEGKYVAEMKDAIEQIQNLFAEGLNEAGTNYQAAMERGGVEYDAETESVAPVMFSERRNDKKRITMSMTDSERTEILKDKVITAEVYEGQADKTIEAEKGKLESHRDNLIKSALVKIGEEFGVFTDYSISDVEIDIRLSKGNLKESVSKKIDPIQIAKLLPVLKSAVENAVGIECHANRYFHDNDTVMFENLIGGYVEGENFVPVRFGLKHSVTGKATLYLIVDQQKIGLKKTKAEVSKATAAQNGRPKTSRSAFNISLASVVPFVNGKDLLRYLPDNMLNAQQKEAKYEAIAETIIYTNNKNDRHYTDYIRAGNIPSAKQMVAAAARSAGYSIKLHHGTAGEPFYVFRLGDEGIHFGTIAQATQRVTAAKERHQYATQTYTEQNLRERMGDLPQAARRYIIEIIVSGTNSLTNAEVAEGYDLADGSRNVSDEDFLRYLDKSERESYRVPNGIMGIDPNSRIIDAYVKAEHPVVFDVDIGEWTTYNIAEALLNKIRGKTMEVYSLADHDWVDYDPAGITGIDLSEADIPVLESLSQQREFSAIVEFLHSKGVDSVRYLNTYEGTADEESYILLSPEQVKSADVITYDDNGDIIPISQRFNSGSNDIRYQERTGEGVSSRAMLADAFESLARTDLERKKVQEYREKAREYDEQEQKLRELRKQIKELSFAKGHRDKKQLLELQTEATRAANRINIYDKQLLRLEASAPLQAVLEREKAKVAKKAEQRRKEAMKEYREEALRKQEQIVKRYQESRKQSVENRNRTAARHKVQRIVNDLNQYLLKGTKERHVPENLQKAVAEALNVVNMDTVGAEERIAKLREELMAAKTPEKVQEISRKIDSVQAMGDRMKDRLQALKDSYAEFIDAEDSGIQNAYDDVVISKMETVIETVGDTPLRDMSLTQLEDVYDMYKAVLTVIRNANKAFKAGKSQNISEISGKVMEEVRGKGKNRKFSTAFMEEVRKFGWDNLKPVYAFEHIGSQTLAELFSNVRSGEDAWAKDVSEAREFYRNTARKHNAESWDRKKRYEFESTSGMSFSLDLEQIMSLYAYSKREQAADHLRRGGIVFDETTEVTMKTKMGIPVKFNPTEATAYNISDATLGEIVGSLTEQQKRFVDEMQEYLSKTMGSKGNEVSMEMYGIRLFKEKNYFPLKSAQQFMAKAKEQQKGEVKIKNSGFSKATVKHASNPVVLTPFMNVWADHVNEMSMYHAFVLPMEDFYRVYNFKTPTSEVAATESVEMLIQNAFGKGATKYIDQLLKDLNGGARSDPTVGLINKGIATFKKGAVFASASVVIQQPSAVARALAMVDARYFIGKLDKQKHGQLWSEVKKYAPVAIIKEMGYFDTNMGKSTEEFILGKEYGSITEKAKALVTDGNYRDEILSRLPALADEMSWCTIWQAVKRETIDKHPGMMTRNREEFMKIVGKRFTEVIVKTQVYDSVLSRSALMRSKDTGMKMATAFMAEPTTSMNMMADALVKAKQGNGKAARTTIGAVIASQILNAMLVSLVYAARDDDEEKSLTEKYISSVVGKVADSMNPGTYIPFVKDIVSIVQGYDVERSDMSVISDLWNAWEKLDNQNLSAWRKVEGFGGSIAQIFGLPLKNIMRDIRAMWQVYEGIVNGEKTTAAGIRYAIQGALTGKDVSKQKQLYEAEIAGDEEHAARVRARYKDESKAASAMRSEIRDRYESGAIDRQSAMDQLVRLGGMDEDDAYWRVEEWDYALNPDSAEDYSKYGKFYDAVRTGVDLKKTIQAYTDNGVDQKTLISQITGHFKEEYVGKTNRDRIAIKGYIVNGFVYCGMSREDALAKVEGWDFHAKYGFDYEDRKAAYRDGKVTAAQLEKILVETGGLTEIEAKRQVKVYDWQNDGIDISSDQIGIIEDFEVHCEPAGISRDVYYDAYLFYKDSGEEGVSYSKTKECMPYIDSLPLTAKQKTALALCWWAESTVNKYKTW